MRLARALRVALALAGAALAACHRAGARMPEAERGSTRIDSIEGVVRVVGLDALPMVTLAMDDATPSVALDGPASLRRVDGLRIAAVGERAGVRLTVRRFVVLAANGVHATDGVLAKDGDATVLVTGDGVRHRLVNAPPLLRDNPGHRAWVSGPLDREPVAFGIIE